MLPIIIVTALQALADPGPGPLDAFRANYASIKVDARYTYTFGPADSKVLNRLWDLEEPEFDESAGPERWLLARWGISKGEVDGVWSCDGSAEHYQFATPEWMFKKAMDHNGGKLPNPLMFLYSKRVGISDGSTWAEYPVSLLNKVRPVHPTSHYSGDSPQASSMRLGPFCWHLTDDSFPRFVETAAAAGARLKRRTSQRDGHPVEVEIHEFDPPEPASKLSRVEISYDPAIGYLPRLARKVYRFDNGEAEFAEMYLLKARPCAAGGFVPVEWYDALYHVPEFARRYPKYDDDTVIEPSKLLRLGHFRVTDLKDRSAPVSLNVEQLKGIHTPGGFVQFPPGTHSLSISELKALVHSRPGKSPGPSLRDLSGKSAKGPMGPTLDGDELSELERFGDQPARKWPWFEGASGVVFAVFIGAIILWQLRLRRTLPLILL